MFRAKKVKQFITLWGGPSDATPQLDGKVYLSLKEPIRDVVGVYVRKCVISPNVGQLFPNNCFGIFLHSDLSKVREIHYVNDTPSTVLCCATPPTLRPMQAVDALAIFSACETGDEAQCFNPQYIKDFWLAISYDGVNPITNYNGANIFGGTIKLTLELEYITTATCHE